MRKYLGSRFVHARPNNVAVHGATEPIFTVLDVRGFEVRDLFLIGFNTDCGTLVVDTEERARAASGALEPAYKTKVYFQAHTSDWWVDYDRRDLDGSEPNRFITDITLKGGRQVMRDGRWVR